MGKSKKNRQKDFQKVKLKVGRRLKKGDNVTNASFKTRTVQVSQQLKTGQVSGPSTKKKQNVAELLSQCRHYNTSVRHDAVSGLRELAVNFPEVVPRHLAAILEKTAELFIDKDATVRQGVNRLLKACLPKVTEKQISPFFPLLCAHLCCAMTHIYEEIQMDSLVILDLLLDTFPHLMVSKSNQVLTNFIDQISRQQGQGRDKGSRSLTSNPNSKTSSVKWRTLVLKRLKKFLMAILELQKTSVGSSMDPQEQELHWSHEEDMLVDTFPVSFKQYWENPGFSLSSSSVGESLDTRDPVQGKFNSFAATLVPLMIECWIESVPNQQTASGSGNLLRPESLDIIVNILNVTQLLGECLVLLENTDSQGSFLGGKYEKDFQQHFLASFPYSLHDVPGKKTDIHDQISAESINLSICDIMTQYLAHGDKSSTPKWLPDVVTYLRDYLRGKYKSLLLGPNLKVVVKVLERIIKLDLDDVTRVNLLGCVFNRYKGAHFLSAEKKAYLKFLSDVCLSSPVLISDTLRSSFLTSLPELLTLVAKERNQEMANLILVTLKAGAVQNCPDVLELLYRGCSRWFCNDGLMAEGEAIYVVMDARNKLEILNLLYFLPNIEREFYHDLFWQSRRSDATETEISYMLQVLNNRYMKNSQDPGQSAEYISFLTKFLIDEDGHTFGCIYLMNRPLGTHFLYNIGELYNDGGSPNKIGIHFTFKVKKACELFAQFVNQEQLNTVVLACIDNFLRQKYIKYEATYGVLKFLNMLTYLPEDDHRIRELCISTLAQSDYDKGALELPVMAADLLMKMQGGLMDLLKRLYDRFEATQHYPTTLIEGYMKLCVFLMTGKRRESVKSLRGCLPVLKSISDHCKSSRSTVKGELVGELAYLVSTLDEVSSLKDICRHQITMGISKENLQQLPLPEILKQFLRYEDSTQTIAFLPRKMSRYE